MKLLLVLPVMGFCFSPGHFTRDTNFHKSFISVDTSYKHTTDGKIIEWPSQKFETDPATEIKYAIDNDTQNLYLALVIPDGHMQMKIMRNGMELYIDPRGKRKEGKGIEFPVKRDPAAENSFMNSKSENNEETSEQETPAQRKTKMKAMRTAMILNLTSMKVFGFARDESEEQGLIMPGSANLAFAWDSADVMCIEYKIPVSLLGEASSLSQKDIGIGWKLNGFQRPSENSSSESAGGHHHGGGYGGASRRNYGSGNSNQGDKPENSFENMMKDQSFWTKYIFR